MYEDGIRDPAFDAEPTYRELLAKVEELELEIERRKKNQRAASDVMTEARERIAELQHKAKQATYLDTAARTQARRADTLGRKLRESRERVDRLIVERDRALQGEQEYKTRYEQRSVVAVEEEINRLNRKLEQTEQNVRYWYDMLVEAESDNEDLKGIIDHLRQDRDKERARADENARIASREIRTRTNRDLVIGQYNELKAEFDRYREYTQAGFKTLYHERRFGPTRGAPRTESIISDTTYKTHEQYGGEYRRQVVYRVPPADEPVELEDAPGGDTQSESTMYPGGEPKPASGLFQIIPTYRDGAPEEWVDEAEYKSVSRTMREQGEDPEGTANLKQAPRHGKSAQASYDWAEQVREFMASQPNIGDYAYLLKPTDPRGYPGERSYDFWGPGGRNLPEGATGWQPYTTKPFLTYVDPAGDPFTAKEENMYVPPGEITITGTVEYEGEPTGERREYFVPETTLADIMGELHGMPEWEREVKARRARRDLSAVFTLVSDRWGEALRRAGEQIRELAHKRLDEQRERIFYGGRTAAEIAQAARIRDQLTRHVRTHARPREELWAGINSPLNPVYGRPRQRETYERDGREL